jgi:hypothetical protein
MDDTLKVIRRFGVVLIVLSLIAVVFIANLFFLNKSSDLDAFGIGGQFREVFYLIVSWVILTLMSGIGIVYPTRWGYILFKCFLYLLLLGFPIGTYISYKTLSYMKRHQIKRHFGFTA